MINWGWLEIEILLDNKLNLYAIWLAISFFFTVRIIGTYCIAIYNFPNLMTLFEKKFQQRQYIYLSTYKIPVAGRSRKRVNR